MSTYQDDELPSGLVRPIQQNQRTLFPQPVEEVLAALKVSRDEIARWHKLGWLSLSPKASGNLDEPEWFELEFVRDLARSGLNDAQISQIVRDLPRPFRYDPRRTVYSFAFGWAQVCEPSEPEERTYGELDDWIHEMAEAGDIEHLKDIAQRIQEEINAVEKDGSQ
ncbi:MAG: hypothetical protein ACPMAQ_03790 [Phycisphaerae bacterium]